MQLDRYLYVKYLCVFLFLSVAKPGFPQNPKDFTNATFLKKLNKDSSYLELKKKIVSVALEEGEGLLFTFGRFLAGRADLLPSPYLYELRKIQSSQKPISPPSLKDQLAEVAATFQGLRTTPGCDVFRAFYQDAPIVVEVYRNSSKPVLGESWDQFCKIIRGLTDGPESGVSQLRVLEQFWEWLQVQADIERKRTILGNLQKLPSDCVSRFPRVIADLQSPTCLAYEAMEGAALDKELLSDSDAANRSLRILAEGILEQSLLLSLVDTELLLDNFLVLPEGRLGFSTLPAWVSVPVEWHQELLQYVASSAAGNTPRALQMLCRMSSSPDAYVGERQLLDQLSSLQPELKINTVTPESVTVLENHWRALARDPFAYPAVSAAISPQHHTSRTI